MFTFMGDWKTGITDGKTHSSLLVGFDWNILSLLQHLVRLVNLMKCYMHSGSTLSTCSLWEPIYTRAVRAQEKRKDFKGNLMEKNETKWKSKACLRLQLFHMMKYMYQCKQKR